LKLRRFKMPGVLYRRKICAYPVWGDWTGGHISFFYDPESRGWYLLYQEQGRFLQVRLFSRGRSFEADYEAALKRTRAESSTVMLEKWRWEIAG
jgi:hypothetical protein